MDTASLLGFPGVVTTSCVAADETTTRLVELRVLCKYARPGTTTLAGSRDFWYVTLRLLPELEREGAQIAPGTWHADGFSPGKQPVLCCSSICYQIKFHKIQACLPSTAKHQKIMLCVLCLGFIHLNILECFISMYEDAFNV